MPIDRPGDPWPGATYKGFAGGRTAAAEPPPRAVETPSRRPSTRTLMIGGVAGALALGILGGLLARPELVGSKPQTAPRAAVASAGDLTPSAAGANTQVPIAVSKPPPPEPLPQTPGRLETLPPEMAAAARLQAPRAAPAAPPAPAASASAAAALPAIAPVAPAPPTAAPAEAQPQYRASFDCAGARPGAEQMVCADPMLASEDREMARAFRRALRSGVEPGDLRQEQRDWVAIREDAARHSRRALVEVYDQRIQELNEIAENAPE